MAKKGALDISTMQKAWLVNLFVDAEEPLRGNTIAAAAASLIPLFGTAIAANIEAKAIAAKLTQEKSRKQLREEFGVILERVYKAWHDDEKTKGCFSEEDYQILMRDHEKMGEFLYDFILKDYREHKCQFLITALHYADELVAAHFPEQVISWLRAKDPNYNDSTTNFVESMNIFHFNSLDSDHPLTLDDLNFTVKNSFNDRVRAVIKNGKVVENNTDCIIYAAGNSRDDIVVMIEQWGVPDDGGRLEVSNTGEKDLKLSISYRSWAPDHDLIEWGEHTVKDEVTLTGSDKVTLSFHRNKKIPDFEMTKLPLLQNDSAKTEEEKNKENANGEKKEALEAKEEKKDQTQTPTTAAEPTTEPKTEPTAEPTAEPKTEPTAEPTAEPTTEPIAEPTTETKTESKTGSSAEPEAQASKESTAVFRTEAAVDPVS